ncbi:MAG: DUF1015 domain-containing protein [Candidatus Omnitrophica bacterium]|nr:DUF1015 domain-containing protein [Candidatus Omnitrophota bacterium]
MAKISSFCALRYNPKKVPVKKVVCPPYDVINHSQRKGYIKASPYNVVRLVLPERKDSTRNYKKAEKDLLQWTEKGILRPDPVKSFYIYVQECSIDGKKVSRCGFISLLKLEKKGNSGVLPHENVFSKPLNDRVNLMKQTKAHLSPIFIVFKDSKAKAQKILTGIIRKNKPELDIYADNSRHKLWQVTDKRLIAELTKHLNSSEAFIADGHHRFRASMATKRYFDTKKTKGDGHSYTLVYLASSEDKGLKILPTYRAVKVLPKGFDIEYIKSRLNGYFDIRPIASRKVDAYLKIAFQKKECAFILYYKKKYLLITLKNKGAVRSIGPKGASLTWKRLDVSILHHLVFEKLLKIREKLGKDRNIYYYKGKNELIKQVDTNSHKLGILLNPSTMEDVIELAKKGEKMPHKSTYFYPKPLTGVAIHKF